MKHMLGTPVSDYMPALGLLVLTILYLATAYNYAPDTRAVPAGVAWVMLVLVILDLISRTRTKAGMALMHSLNPAGDADKMAIAARLRKETTLTVKAIAARVHLGTSKSANARLHAWLGNGRPADSKGTLQLGL